ncbi:alpha/beta fold hydrolase [Pseudonocardia sp. TRM90224]|uniref:alpha/beta fold hydrolase n=1 Tax=Pseudonocardia sp. TRM90224 TaxID=2812678 RepID=UPI001E284CBA|nr:alpha/beta fold hydrolase [Pseudonocardia sp. TRM90224]
MRKLVLTGVAALLCGTACTTAGPLSAAPSPLSFGACPADLAEQFPTMTCATFEAPLDYAHPDGPTITLLASRIAAGDPAKRRGTLFVNPGGPGSSAAARIGTITVPDQDGVTRLPQQVIDAYDLIGLDPRGVGHSSPISCVDPEFWNGPQPDPDDPANLGRLWEKWRTFAAGCASRSGDVLAHIGTIDAARDMDLLRSKLGERTISFYGTSYATYLGAVYGELFPQRVDRMLLDAPVDPEPGAMWFEAGFAQAPALEQRFDGWLAWAAAHDDLFHLGATVEAARATVDGVLADLRAAPRGPVGVGEVLGTIYNALFSEVVWNDLATAMSAYAVGHDDSALVGMSTPHVTPEQEQAAAAATAVSCVDAQWPSDHTAYESRAAEATTTSRFAWWNMWLGGAACADWPVPHGERVPITGAGLPPVLMFSPVGDPGAPHAGALAMHRVMPSSVMVTEADSGKHGAFANQQAVLNQTAQDIGAAYLVRGELPAHDITIPGHAVPAASLQDR